MTLDDGALARLRKCRLGACGIRLDETMLSALSGQQRDEDLIAALRRSLAAHTAAYLEVGDRALMTYRDRKAPIPSGEELHRIIGRSPYLREVPGVLEHLAAPAAALPPAVEHFVYWSVEAPGSKPVLSPVRP